MKTLLLTLAVLVLHQRASYGRSLIVINNGEKGTTPKLRHSLALKKKHVYHKVPNRYHPTSTSDRELANFYEERQNNDENPDIGRLLHYMLRGEDADLGEEIKYSEAYGKEGFEDPVSLQIDLDDTKRAFPQSFESLFIENTLENETHKKEIDTKQSEDDLLKIAEDLRQLDLFDMAKRSKHKMKKEDRPPRPG